ncbi:MAG: PTS-dependent dihydroxyacetone kinase phosphotransferase subunit DhaM [Lachnospiraceae bacterium]|uniref:phosphoenolpyruvate--glycerone phosphotransferase n=1 Tax=Candidatus Weimeria bifida TaxID=2599074 RepID=A0A6N7IXV4_9FIRM|nr:PTS-dependent dihydroxyacetone kinase phosphotransferase subunit DhaM [Candidatus Weimeria bifida]RRF95560.1 MAG: PTS-dependent dihydroxyacetone kinase phosphotransferase subunit DhaM [Lachnospiraceae bacterium]
MVGIVIVSHSENLAKSVVELTTMMAKGVPIEPAGGLEDGSFGTSYDRIRDAIDKVYSDDGVIVLMDMGSSVLTTQSVIEMEEDGKKVEMVDCPLVEGAVSASLDSSLGESMEQIIDDLKTVATTPKM